MAARGTPIVQILIFKHNENKLKHLYQINTMPELPNPEHPEMNPNQSYKDFPCKLKLSLDFVFLSIVTCAGAVHLLKMPPILNPLNPEQTFNEDKAPPTGDKGLTASQNI